MNILPVLVIKQTSVFPTVRPINMVFGRKDTLDSISHSQLKYANRVLVISQINEKIEKINVNNLNKIGVISVFRESKKRNLSGVKTIQVNGLERAKVTKFIQKDNLIFAEFDVLKDKKLSIKEQKEISEHIFKTISQFKKNISDKIKKELIKQDRITNFLYILISNSSEKKIKYKQKTLETDSVYERFQIVIRNIKWSADFDEDYSNLIDDSISNRIKLKLSKRQRKYILLEKLNAIKEELGMLGEKSGIMGEYLARLEKEPFPVDVKYWIREDIKRFQTLPPGSGESSMLKGYIDWVMSLPWYQKTKENTDIKQTETILNRNHSGLKKAKERIIEHLASSIFSKKTSGQIICLVGPPGVGKTSLGISIAEALNRNYVRIALGGVKDESEIRGHRKTYIGSMPGKIIQSMKKAKALNPVILIDEIDKMSSDFRGDPSSAMLEVLDPEQNKEFTDHYIEKPYDLSQVMFIATANYEGNIPYALHDRMEIIHLYSYTELEKIQIAKEHLVPKVLKSLNLKKQQIQFTQKGIEEIIKYYTRESGVRELQRLIAKIARKYIVRFLTKQIKSEVITDKNVIVYLEKRLYEHTRKNDVIKAGVVTGLAYTSFGGDILPIETIFFEGQGNLILTGKLGTVMKESASIAYDLIKANAKAFGIKIKNFNKIDVHIHVPEGAVPKDGPSAGVTLTTAIVSLFKNQPVSNNIAMTGEITLRGKVLPIGGLKEKAISAERSGIKTIIIPKENEKDIVDIPIEIKKKLKIVSVSEYSEIYNFIFDK